MRINYFWNLFLYKNNSRKFLKSYLSHEKQQKLEKIMGKLLEVGMNMIDQKEELVSHKRM